MPGCLRRIFVFLSYIYYLLFAFVFICYFSIFSLFTIYCAIYARHIDIDTDIDIAIVNTQLHVDV